MAIDLPPALPPQLSKLEVIERYTSSGTPYIGTVNGYELRVTGDHHLTNEEMDKIFSAAKTPSQAIILMNAMESRKGHLLVAMHYAPDVNKIYVHATRATLTDVRGEGISEYFEELKGDSDLTRAEFDKARIMANVKSDRSGVNYSAHFELNENNPQQAVLVFEGSQAADHDPTDVTVQVGNQGSRFVGRYFGDVGVTHDFSNGVRMGAAYQTAFTDLGESRGGEDYHQVQVSLDRPFASGLYGISASHVEYSQDLGDVTTSGSVLSDTALCDVLSLLGLCSPTSGSTTQQAELNSDVDTLTVSGEQIVASDLNYRINVFERLQYVDSQIDIDNVGTLQDERYGVAEVGVKYFNAQSFNDQLMRWSAQISVEAGVTGDKGTLGTYDEFQAANPGAEVPQVAPAARTAEYVAIKPKATIKLPVSEAGSFNGNFISQFADEQVPQQQQWVLGGMGSISAFLPGVLVGDSGYFALFNYEHKSKLGMADLTTSIFTEYGSAWYENASGDEGEERSIADAGVRMRAEFDYDFTVDAVMARKITDDGFDDEDRLDDLKADFYVTLKKGF